MHDKDSEKDLYHGLKKVNSMVYQLLQTYPFLILKQNI